MKRASAINQNWQVFGASVTGSVHRKTGRTNEDALLWHHNSTSVHGPILAISDGHGSSKCFRSQLGSKFATEAAVTQLLWARSALQDNLIAFKRDAKEQLTRQIHRSWRESVLDDIHNTPFTHAEKSALILKSGKEAWREVLTNPLIAYGATLLAVITSARFVLTLQLGDGDILIVDKSGAVSRVCTASEMQIGEETLSLCAPDANECFIVNFQEVNENSPALIVLSTDGYSNSFQNEEGFLRVGSDLLAILKEEGVDALKKSIPDWLEESSLLGSGDDVTLGVVATPVAFRLDSIVIKECDCAR